jgi:hypothetical protein
VTLMMSAIGTKADIPEHSADVRLWGQSGYGKALHHPRQIQAPDRAHFSQDRRIMSKVRVGLSCRITLLILPPNRKAYRSICHIPFIPQPRRKHN